MGGSEEDVWHRVMRLRQLAAGAILLPFCFLKLEKLRFYIKKNGKTGENFESVHKVSMAFVVKKMVLSIYGNYQRVAAKIAVSELHFLRG